MLDSSLLYQFLRGTVLGPLSLIKFKNNNGYENLEDLVSFPCFVFIGFWYQVAIKIVYQCWSDRCTLALCLYCLLWASVSIISLKWGKALQSFNKKCELSQLLTSAFCGFWVPLFMAISVLFILVSSNASLFIIAQISFSWLLIACLSSGLVLIYYYCMRRLEAAIARHGAKMWYSGLVEQLDRGLAVLVVFLLILLMAAFTMLCVGVETGQL